MNKKLEKPKALAISMIFAIAALTIVVVLGTLIF